MAKLVQCPHHCGQMIDYDAVPSYSNARQKSGKFCPTCGGPLDMDSHAKDTVDYGGDSKAVMEARAERIKAFDKARGATAPTPA